MESKPSKPNPYLNANAWSRIFHSWISKLLDKSHEQKTLHQDDLYELLSQYQPIKLTDKLEKNWFTDLERYPAKPSFSRATFRGIGWELFLIGCLFLPVSIMNIAEALLIASLMNFFEPCSSMSVQYAFTMAILIVLTTQCTSFFSNRFYYSIETFGLRLRVAYHGLMYRKLLRLSSHSLNTFSSGKITNLFSNDASQIEKLMYSIHYLWIAPVEIISMIIIFWYFVKYVAVIAIGYTALLVLLLILIGRVLVHFRAKILEKTDQRIKIMSEIIQSMRIVKMYCWESAFEKKIRLVRKQEIIRYALSLIPESIQMLLSHTYICITFFIIYGTMWAINIRFDTRFFAIAAYSLSYLEFLLMEFGTAIRNLVNYLTAAKRIQTFLLLDESQRDHRLSSSVNNLGTDEHLPTYQMNIEKKNLVETPIKKPTKVECNLQQAQWEQNGLFCLKNIVFDAHPGDLICVIGPIGSGKSSLLQTLTGEIAFFDGKVRLRGSFCYVPQEPWIFSSTVKENILFGKAYDPQLFQRVIHAAALEPDIDQLSNGVNTIVGDQGVMISGGQKARVNMARALYRNADIYLLDDPLSAVDVKVSKHLFEKSIKSYLRDKICILVTHQIQFLQDATKIIVLENGEMVQTGTYEELLASSLSFNRLLENIHQQEQEQEKHERSISTVRQRSLEYAPSIASENEDALLMNSASYETKKEGSVKWHVYVAYLQAGVGRICGVLLLIVIFGFREAVLIFHGQWLAEWSDDESQRHRNLNNCTNKMTEKIIMIRSMNSTEWNIYRNNRFYFYCGIALVLLIISLIRIITMKFICLNSGRTLHNRMFRRLIRCPISFFDLNPVGRILNRFTKDIAVLDEHLPFILFDFLQCICQVFGVVVLVSWLNLWSIIPATIATIGMVFIRYRFARCSRDLKRLENTSRSPIYSYLTSTVHGLKVVRSYHAEKTCLSEFFSHLDDNTRANYLLLTTNRWAAIRFDWYTAFFVAIVTMMAVIIRISGRLFSEADIALTLSYSLNLMGLMQWTIRQSVELETQMTSVERVLEYCALDQEPPDQVPEKYRPPTNWPSHGHIVFNNVSMSHSKDSDTSLALNHISFTIQAGEKIGIVGRTGAGKSSLIQTLFRMGILVDGQIVIDDVDISTVGLDDIRRRISVIPQDPVLFTGTMKSNLDQFGDYSDTEIWHALEQVQLKKRVNDVMSHGLHSLVSESGSNLSVGQKQLVCLARAILKKSKILVVDEATANVDNVTDELIQRAIREKFKGCTVLTIAHRLRTVIDSDRIMVLENGSVLEFDTPQTLLLDRNSHLSSLVKQTGSAEAEHLRMLAKSGKLQAQQNEETGAFNGKGLEDDSETNLLFTSI